MMITKSTIEKRINDLHAFGQVLRQEKDRLAEYLVKEAGLTIKDKLWEVEISAHTLETFEREKPLIIGRQSDGGKAIFVPYNDPIFALATGLGPAYLASQEGDTIVLKFPTEKFPELADFMKNSIQKTMSGIKFFNGSGREFLPYVVESSTRNIMLYGHHSWVQLLEPLFRLSGQTVVFEGGSNNPFVITENAELESAASAAYKNNILYSGQACFSSKRFYVHSSLHADFVKLIKEKIDGTFVGDPLDPNTQVGVNSSKKAVTEILSQLEQAKQKGARVYGGKTKFITVGNKQMVALYPAIVFNGTPDLDVIVKETFGPIMAVLSYDDEFDLLRQIINSEYALIVTIWGNLKNLQIQDQIFRSHGYHFHNSSMVDWLMGTLDAWHEQWKGYGKSAWTWQTLSNGEFITRQAPKYFIQEFSKPSEK